MWPVPQAEPRLFNYIATYSTVIGGNLMLLIVNILLRFLSNVAVGLPVGLGLNLIGWCRK